MWPERFLGPRIWRAPTLNRACWHRRPVGVRVALELAGMILLLSTAPSCTHQQGARAPEPTPAIPTPIVVALAPVMNLSNSSEWDPLQVTDMLASELQTFPGVTVVPVNRSLAVLAARGAIAAPQDAVELADALDADGALVAAVTEFDPYDPPRIGWVMQWYANPRRLQAAWGAQPGRGAGAKLSAAGPQLQVQRIISAAVASTQRELREYADSRGGFQSPYDWRVHVKSQRLFVRYSCWTVIRSMLQLRGGEVEGAPRDEAHEADSWNETTAAFHSYAGDTATSSAGSLERSPP